MSRAHCHAPCPPAMRMRGLSLVELLVALAIGALLIFATTQVYVDSRNAYTNNETVDRLEETARYALAVIEPDVRMAGYLGFVKGAANLANETTFNSDLASVTAANVCGTGFIGNLENPLQGDNNSYTISTTKTAACDALSGWTTNAVASADTLIVRRASALAADLTTGRVQVCSTRVRAYLFDDGAVPTGCSSVTSPSSTSEGQINNLIVSAYYIDQNSEEATGLPSLRRKELTVSGAAPAFEDAQVIAGVEDMQIEYGIEDAVDATTGEYTGVANRYVDAATAQTLVDAGGQVVAVRIWLLVRSDTPETGFIDGKIYQYADRATTTGLTANLASDGVGKAFEPTLDATTGLSNLQHYRRLLVSRTIQLRNASGT
ncbi:MAG: PilW family protein [Steroidobacteraceae bacterium]